MKYFIEVNDEGWVRNEAIIPRGKWYFPCCQHDLTQSDNDEAMWSMYYYDTKWEAKIEIIKQWIRSYKNIGLRSALTNVLLTIFK